MIYHLFSIQVTDVENIYGLVQLETIQVHAEAYDVALDMTFPKGNSPHRLYRACSHLFILLLSFPLVPLYI